ncbi:hypothetical protein KSP39_PZI016837 [Platanthera zijinensis]|uniref:Uncharacterized protein n=1 Tax=Platanthera zijinensis TaxID=2320716 RepID=A0AAP0G0L7_9ASPA
MASILLSRACAAATAVRGLLSPSFRNESGDSLALNLHICRYSSKGKTKRRTKKMMKTTTTETNSSGEAATSQLAAMEPE